MHIRLLLLLKGPYPSRPKTHLIGDSNSMAKDSVGASPPVGGDERSLPAGSGLQRNASINPSV